MIAKRTKKITIEIAAETKEYFIPFLYPNMKNNDANIKAFGRMLIINASKIITNTILPLLKIL